MMTAVFNPARIGDAIRARKMSTDDLAYEIRRLSGGQVRANSSQVLKWIQGKHQPRASVVGLIAEATRTPVDFFYSTDDPDEADGGEEPG